MDRRHLLSMLAGGTSLLVPSAMASAQNRNQDVVAAQRAAREKPSVSTTGALAEPDDERLRRQKGWDRPFPGSRIARGTRNIAAAWLARPVQRYRHHVLGGESEPESLVVVTAEKRFHRLTLPKDAVFEDRHPRIADVNGDGLDEVVVVKSNQRTGSSVVIAGVNSEATGLEIMAESEAPGEPFRWLNPAGVADFIGRGRPILAAVRQPHRLGELDLMVWRNGRLETVETISDVSNHAIGSSHQGLSAVADFDGDGVADLAIPSFDRRTLRFLSFKGGRLRDLGRVSLPAVAQEDFSVVTVGGRRAVDVGLASGRRVVVQL